MTRGRLLFLATEDWFVRSHFLPLIRRAHSDGWRVIVAARMGDARHDIEAAGAEAAPLRHSRGDNSIPGVIAAMREIGALFKTYEPALVHAIALKPAFLTALARGHARNAAFVYALTGLGHLGVSSRPSDQAMRRIVLSVIAHALRSESATLAVENRDDLAQMAGIAGSAIPTRAVVLPGAGVDPDVFKPSPTSTSPPVRIGFASRLVHSKGLDLLIEAYKLAKVTCPDIELDVAGEIDTSNPGAIDAQNLSIWSTIPGVRFYGHVADMRAFWNSVHIACIPTRGGEGLPRTLLEAAACGVPTIVTRVPGCKDFVRDGETGLIVPPNDIDALTRALAHLAGDLEARTRLGAAARHAILEGHTERRVADLASAMWLQTAARTPVSGRMP